MKLFVIGANGYAGSHTYDIACGSTSAYEAIGTYATRPREGLVQFRIEDKVTWSAVAPQDGDVIIWAVNATAQADSDRWFEEWAASLPAKTTLLYLSSDIVLCPRALQSMAPIGEYARKKLREQSAVLARPNSAVFTVGPIFGMNSQGDLDKRTSQLLESSAGRHEYWEDVYKTFVPVDGLVKTLLANLDKRGHYFIGPKDKKSFFDFYLSRAIDCGRSTEMLKPVTISDSKLEKIGQCRDISYSNNSNRLWIE